MIVALADGCNWGHRPREAAIRATTAFMNYLDTHHEQTSGTSNDSFLLFQIQKKLVIFYYVEWIKRPERL